jgi:hypothetical protein
MARSPLPSGRVAEISTIIEAKRMLHPELRRPLSLGGLKGVLYREFVRLEIRPHSRDAELVPIMGRWVIMVDERQPKEFWCLLAAHELAHLWLHHDPFHDRTETMVYRREHGPLRELEADVCASLLIAGSNADRPAPERYVKTYEPRPRVIVEARAREGVCSWCGVGLGEGADRVPRAMGVDPLSFGGTDTCVDCATLRDEPTPENMYEWEFGDAE